MYKTRTGFSDNRKSHVYVIAASGGEPRCVTCGRYDEHAIPNGPTYGPFHGELVTDSSSTYEGGYDYKITDRLHLFLPWLDRNFESARLGRDRDSAKQNAAVELAVNGQGYDSILHLRCTRSP